MLVADFKFLKLASSFSFTPHIAGLDSQGRAAVQGFTC